MKDVSKPQFGGGGGYGEVEYSDGELREYIQYGSGNFTLDTIVRSLVWYHDVEFYDDETFRQIDRAEYNNTSKGLIYRKIK